MHKQRVLQQIKLRHFRCFRALECEFAPTMNLIVGPNAQGKTSLLEAACVLLRLQSPRVSTLARAIQHDQRGFVVDGFFANRHLQFYFGSQRRKLALDSVEQKSSGEYLQTAHVVWFANNDLALVHGTSEARRKFLDFIAAQIDAKYRPQLRAYERALRARNHLLRQPTQRWREIAAFDAPLVDAGNFLTQARRRLLAELQPHATESQFVISEKAESLRLEYLPGAGEDFEKTLAAQRDEDARLRQTTAGPHRDDFALTLNESAAHFASEGQQRTISLALKLAQARLLAATFERAPLLLLDDIFGELDLRRRNALMTHLPADSQKIVTTTHLDWLADSAANAANGEVRVMELRDGALTLR